MILERLLLCGVLMAGGIAVDAEELVILHTNDTHSQIEPNDRDLGGILRRKVLVDSVRAVHDNVLLIDAGDAVQGTLYFTLYGGEVERKMMNALGYDIQILGNHEFDNGMEALAEQWRGVNAEKLSTNYDMRGTPLDTLFAPYTIKRYGNSLIGVIALNLDPKGMIADKNSEGIVYLDAIEAANATAWHLKHNEHVDGVIAVTHIGYDTSNPPTPSDIDLAAASKNIDLIIGGHSHTTIDPKSPKSPAFHVVNAVGDTVLVTQTGSRGQYLGEIVVDLPSMKSDYRLLTVDRRLDDRIDRDAASILEPYKAGVERLMGERIGRLDKEMSSSSDLLLNWVADVMLEMGGRLSPDSNVDLSIVNKGGIRRGLPKGDITMGQIMTMLPFDNHLVLLELEGSDLIGAFKVMEHRGGDGVSAGFDWRNIDPERLYRVVTIDYLANGGDYMEPLTHGKITARSDEKLDEVMIKYIVEQKNKTIKYNDNKPRM